MRSCQSSAGYEKLLSSLLVRFLEHHSRMGRGSNWVFHTDNPLTRQCHHTPKHNRTKTPKESQQIHINTRFFIVMGLFFPSMGVLGCNSALLHVCFTSEIRFLCWRQKFCILLLGGTNVFTHIFNTLLPLRTTWRQISESSRPTELYNDS